MIKQSNLCHMEMLPLLCTKSESRATEIFLGQDWSTADIYPHYFNIVIVFFFFLSS
jgi:hypothetical protein